jgi:hypothetical protein
MGVADMIIDKLEDLPSWVQLAFAVYEAFRRLEFSPDDIYFRNVEDTRTGKPEGELLIVSIEKPRDTPIYFFIVQELRDVELPRAEQQALLMRGLEMWNDPKNRADCILLWERMTVTEKRLNFFDLSLAMQCRGLVNLNEVIARSKASDTHRPT